MESKKRPHAQESDASVSKKRILTGSNGAPYANGADTEEPSDFDKLEAFRKEAIFRRMRHYSREHDRSQSRIAELERRKDACEAGLAAMAACWTQLVEAIRLVAKPEDLPPNAPNARDLFDLSSHISEDDAPDLATALADNMHATRNLVTKFVSLSSGSGENAYVKFQKAQTECAALRSQIQVIHGKLRDSEAQKTQYYERLVAAETAADRLRSTTVNPTKPRSEASALAESPREATEEQRKPSSPVPSTSSNTAMMNGPNGSMEHEDRVFLADLREKEVLDLREEVATLTAKNKELTLITKIPSLEFIHQSAHYRVLLDHSSFLTHALAESQQENTRLADELQAALDSRKEWQEGVESAATQANQELKSMLAKRDAENARLREQRDQQTAELSERKQKDAVKFASMKELQSLAESRSARISVLQSQLARHKAQLAANAGNEDLMQFFFSGQLEDVAYIEELKSRVIEAEQSAAAVNQTLSIFQDDHPNVVQHMEAEADALQKLAAAVTKLDKYEKLFGDLSAFPPEIGQLTEKLRMQEDEMVKLRLSNEQHAKEKNSVYSELDQLSTAWEALDRQLNSKVFDLRELEDRLAKAGADKAKAETKYFSSIQDKNRKEEERKTWSRTAEKQGKAVERLTESEQNLNAQVLSLEKDLASVRRQYEARSTEATALKLEVREQKTLYEGDMRKYTECRNLLTERDTELAEKKAELQKMSEQVALSKRQLERQMAKVQERASGSSSTRELELESELKQTLNVLKCTACKGAEFRNTVLTKCFHTFCKSCVDARLSTRQRKCPACNAAFGAADVQQIWLQ